MTNTYNTRRKSLSLEALGVQVPGLGRGHSHRSSMDAKADSSGAQASQQNSHTRRVSDSHGSPPAKRIKRSHSPSDATSPTSQQALSAAPAQQKSPSKLTPPTKPQSTDPPRTQSRHGEYTPPPSPLADDERKLDYESINDDIVEGVVRQLEKTGNRPHLIKELAAVLSTTHDAVTSSANAPALLSSRLANYMKRSCWSASSQCPVGKELIPIHPRKVFYYLTDRQRQVLPDTSDDIYGPLGITSPTRSTPPAATPTTAGVGIMGPPATIPAKRVFAPATLGTVGFNVSPPLSNASVVEDDVESADCRSRQRFSMSPSPEVDLSIHATDYEHSDEDAASKTAVLESYVDDVKHDFPTPPADLSSQSSYVSARSSVSAEPKSGGRSAMSSRHQSPPLEGDEHEFMGTARSFRERSSGVNTPSEAPENAKKLQAVKEEEHAGEENRYEMFTQQRSKEYVLSSPAFAPQNATKHQSKASIDDVVMLDADMDIGESLYKWDLKAPCDIQVDDLDALLADC